MPERPSAAASIPTPSSEDLRRISGIGSAVSGRLEDAGVHTIHDLAESTPEELADILAGLPGCSPARIAEMDWIGQARRLAVSHLDTTPAVYARSSAETPPSAPSQPPSDATAPLRVIRVGGASPRMAHCAKTDEPTAVALQLGPGAGAPEQTFDYSAAITAHRLDAKGEVVVARLTGAVRVGEGVSHAAAGPSLKAGLYRLAATVEAYAPAHTEGDKAVWAETVTGGLLHVIAPGTAVPAEVPPKLRDRLLADGAITQQEHADLAAAPAP